MKSSYLPRVASLAVAPVSTAVVPALVWSRVLVAPNTALGRGMLSLARYTSSTPDPVSTATGARRVYGPVVSCWLVPHVNVLALTVFRVTDQPPFWVVLQNASTFVPDGNATGSRSW